MCQFWSIASISMQYCTKWLHFSCTIEIFFGKFDDHPCMAFPPALIRTRLFQHVHIIFQRIVQRYYRLRRMCICVLSFIRHSRGGDSSKNDQLMLLFECNSNLLDSIEVFLMFFLPTIIMSSTYTDKNSCDLPMHGETFPRRYMFPNVFLKHLFQSSSPRSPAKGRPYKYRTRGTTVFQLRPFVLVFGLGGTLIHTCGSH